MQRGLDGVSSKVEPKYKGKMCRIPADVGIKEHVNLIFEQTHSSPHLFRCCPRRFSLPDDPSSPHTVLTDTSGGPAVSQHNTPSYLLSAGSTRPAAEF